MGSKGTMSARLAQQRGAEEASNSASDRRVAVLESNNGKSLGDVLWPLDGSVQGRQVLGWTKDYLVDAVEQRDARVHVRLVHPHNLGLERTIFCRRDL